MNKVIIVGGDHHNGLNLARIFGINNVPVEAVVVTPYKKSWIAKSKFILKSYCVTTEKAAFDYILMTYKEEPEKPFIIPCSDGAALELDLRLDEFKDWAYVPSINNSQGEIAKLMASVQAAVYGSEDCVLDPQLFREVVDYKAAEHQQRRKFADESANNL